MYALLIAMGLGVISGWLLLCYGHDPLDHDKVDHERNGPLEGE